MILASVHGINVRPHYQMYKNALYELSSRSQAHSVLQHSSSTISRAALPFGVESAVKAAMPIVDVNFIASESKLAGGSVGERCSTANVLTKHPDVAIPVVYN